MHPLRGLATFFRHARDVIVDKEPPTLRPATDADLDAVVAGIKSGSFTHKQVTTARFHLNVWRPDKALQTLGFGPELAHLDYSELRLYQRLSDATLVRMADLDPEAAAELARQGPPATASQLRAVLQHIGGGSFTPKQLEGAHWALQHWDTEKALTGLGVPPELAKANFLLLTVYEQIVDAVNDQRSAKLADHVQQANAVTSTGTRADAEADAEHFGHRSQQFDLTGGKGTAK